MSILVLNLKKQEEAARNFIQQAKRVHQGRYDYGKTTYKTRQTKVTITCPLHGDFEQTPNNHLSGKTGCKACRSKIFSEQQRFTKDAFLLRAKEVHGEQYDYSQATYLDYESPLKIIHKQCGATFYKSPRRHLAGAGCEACYLQNRAARLRKSVSQANLISNQRRQQQAKDTLVARYRARHGNKYDYSQVEYVNGKTKITIVCPVHGQFSQLPSNHLVKGCQRCRESRLEIEFAKTLSRMKINYRRGVAIHDYSSYKRFDFYLEDYQLYVELDGQHHFEAIFGPKAFKRTQATDQRTDAWCSAHSVRLLRIAYNENPLTRLRDKLKELRISLPLLLRELK